MSRPSQAPAPLPSRHYEGYLVRAPNGAPHAKRDRRVVRERQLVRRSSSRRWRAGVGVCAHRTTGHRLERALVESAHPRRLHAQSDQSRGGSRQRLGCGWRVAFHRNSAVDLAGQGRRALCRASSLGTIDREPRTRVALRVDAHGPAHGARHGVASGVRDRYVRRTWRIRLEDPHLAVVGRRCGGDTVWTLHASRSIQHHPDRPL